MAFRLRQNDDRSISDGISGYRSTSRAVFGFSRASSCFLSVSIICPLPQNISEARVLGIVSQPRRYSESEEARTAQLQTSRFG